MPRYRLLIPLSAALFCVIVFTSLSLHVRSQEHYAVRVHLEEIATNLQYNLTERVEMNLNGLERMAERWIRVGGTDQTEWRADALDYVGDHAELRSVQWANPDFVLEWVEPVAGNEAVIGLDILFEEFRARAVMQAVNSRRANNSAAIDFIQGGTGFLAYFPLYDGDRFDGLIVGVFDAANMVAAGLPQPMAECMAGRMADRLSIDQLRKLESLRPEEGEADIPLNIAEFLERVRRVDDPEVLEVSTTSAAICAFGAG